MIIQKPYTFSSNTSIRPSDVNADIDTIYNAFNGNISAANLADNAITTVKITDGTITSDNIADGAITTAKIADDAVTAAKIDWASTGADGGIWWEELGRTTLSGSADTITVSSIEPRTYLRVLIYTLATGGNQTAQLRFNGDSGNNYSSRSSDNGGADGTSTSVGIIGLIDAATSTPFWGVYDIANVSTSEKLLTGVGLRVASTGAATAPSRRERVGKWANTTDYISSVGITNDSTGDYATGSILVVLGHN